MTENHPRNYDNSLYHAFIRDGAIYLSDGTSRGKLSETTETDLNAWDLTKVFQGDPDNVAWMCDLELDAAQRPYVAFTVQKDGRGLPRGQGGSTTGSNTPAGTARRGGCTRSPTPAGGCTPGKTTTPDSPPSMPGIRTSSTSRPTRTPSRARRSSAAPMANATASCTGARPGTSARRGGGSRLPRTPTRITCGRSCPSGPTRGRRSCGCAGHTRTIMASGRQRSSRSSCHDPPILAHRTPRPAGPRRLGRVPRAPRLGVGPPPDRVGRERVHRQRAARRDDRCARQRLRMDDQPYRRRGPPVAFPRRGRRPENRRGPGRGGGDGAAGAL